MNEQEINKIIHEKVMGYSLDLHSSEGVLWIGDIPDYAGDISAAFEVVEKMKVEKKFEWRGLSNHDGNVSIFTNYLQTVGVRGDDKTMPMAICKAAIQAIEANK